MNLKIELEQNSTIYDISSYVTESDNIPIYFEMEKDLTPVISTFNIDLSFKMVEEINLTPAVEDYFRFYIDNELVFEGLIKNIKKDYKEHLFNLRIDSLLCLLQDRRITPNELMHALESDNNPEHYKNYDGGIFYPFDLVNSVSANYSLFWIVQIMFNQCGLSLYYDDVLEYEFGIRTFPDQPFHYYSFQGKHFCIDRTAFYFVNQPQAASLFRNWYETGYEHIIYDYIDVENFVTFWEWLKPILGLFGLRIVKIPTANAYKLELFDNFTELSVNDNYNYGYSPEDHLAKYNLMKMSARYARRDRYYPIYETKTFEFDRPVDFNMNPYVDKNKQEAIDSKTLSWLNNVFILLRDPAQEGTGKVRPPQTNALGQPDYNSIISFTGGNNSYDYFGRNTYYFLKRFNSYYHKSELWPYTTNKITTEITLQNTIRALSHSIDIKNRYSIFEIYTHNEAE